MGKIYVDISVIIPTMNRPNTLINTVKSYIEKKYIPSEIIIIDQTSNSKILKETINILNSMHKNIIYIHQEFPSSTKARNTGINVAKNDLIVFSDDDIEIFEETLFSINDIMKNKNISMIAGIDVLTKNKKNLLSYVSGRKSYKYRKIGHVTNSVFGRYPIDINDEISTQWAMGYFFCVRKSLLNKWNLYWDENLTGYAYAEDLDFTFSYYKNSLKENKKCILNTRVKVKHLVSNEWRTTPYKKTLMFIINREYLRKKHFNSIYSQIWFYWANAFEFFYRIIKKDNSMDLLKAQIICLKYKKYVREGALKKLIDEKYINI